MGFVPIGGLADLFRDTGYVPGAGFAALPVETKASITADLERFEESGDAAVLDPTYQATVQARLLDVPAAQRWTDYGPYHDTWQNLWNRYRYRIEDAAPSYQSPSVGAWDSILSTADKVFGRDRVNAVLEAQAPAIRAGESPADPANRGLVDDARDAAGVAFDRFGQWLPWVALGLVGLGVVVVALRVR